MDKYVIAPPAGSTNNSIGASDRPWKEGHFDAVKIGGGDLGTYLAESTGFGIVSGCEPSISGLTVTVGAGIVHLADGTRKEISASSITLDAADSTNPRIDLVYITSNGTVAKITGTASASPSAPSVPVNGIAVCAVSVAANAVTGTVSQVRIYYTDKDYLTPDFFGGQTDLEKIQACIDYAIKNRIRDIKLIRRYDVTGGSINININIYGQARNKLHIFGGEIYKGDSGYIFDAPIGSYTSGLCVESVSILGNANNDFDQRCDVYNAKSLIRINSINNYIYGVRDVFRCTEGNHSVMQSCRGLHDTAVYCRDYIYALYTITDSSLNDCIIESCYYGVYVSTATQNTINGLRLTNTLIEGTTSHNLCITPRDGAQQHVAGLVIENCYFEDVLSYDRYTLYLDTYFYGSRISACTFSFVGATLGRYIYLHAFKSKSQLTLDNNKFNKQGDYVVYANCDANYAKNTVEVSQSNDSTIGYLTNFSNAPDVFNFLSNTTQNKLCDVISKTTNGTFTGTLRFNPMSDTTYSKIIFDFMVLDDDNNANYIIGKLIITSGTSGTIKVITESSNVLAVSNSNNQGTLIVTGLTNNKGTCITSIKTLFP